MSHHLKSIADQIKAKGSASAPFHYKQKSYSIRKAIVESKSVTKIAPITKDEAADISRLINEGDPNT